MKRLHVVALVVTGGLAAGLSLGAQASDSGNATLEKLVNETLQAQDRDAAWYEKNLADDYMEGRSWGEWQDRAGVIKEAQAKAIKTSKGEATGLKISHYGPKIAVARYKYTYDAMMNGTHRARSVICSDVWIDQSAGWKMISNHCSHIEGS